MKTPFNMLIVGSSGCGKTHYLLRELETQYHGEFDFIFLICPTYDYNKTYQGWRYKDDPDFFPIACDQDDVEDRLRWITKRASGTNSLIILDDTASSQSVKNRTSELVRLAFSARHYGLSVIVITQQLTSIAKPFRDNVSKVVSFYSPSKATMDIIFAEFLGSLDKTAQRGIWKALESPRARLEIDLRQRTHLVKGVEKK